LRSIQVSSDKQRNAQATSDQQWQHAERARESAPGRVDRKDRASQGLLAAALPSPFFSSFSFFIYFFQINNV
jgi:hypothetical protein